MSDSDIPDRKSMSWPNRLAEIASMLGIGQSELAQMMELDRQRIHKFWKGRTQISTDMAKKLARVMGIDWPFIYWDEPVSAEMMDHRSYANYATSRATLPRPTGSLSATSGPSVARQMDAEESPQLPQEVPQSLLRKITPMGWYLMGMFVLLSSKAQDSVVAHAAALLDHQDGGGKPPKPDNVAHS